MKKMLMNGKSFSTKMKERILRVRKMTPAGDLEYFEMIMENDDSYIVQYNPSSGEAMVYMHQDAGGDLAAAALQYIQQDAPYDQEILPSDEPETRR